MVDPHSGIPDRGDVSVYADMLQALAQNHIDFHIVDTDILEMGQIGDGVVKVKDVCACVVVVPPMKVMEDPLREWLEAFRKGGGRVVGCSEGQTWNRVLEQILEVAAESQRAVRRERACGCILPGECRRADRSGSLNTGGQTVDAECVWDRRLRLRVCS